MTELIDCIRCDGTGERAENSTQSLASGIVREPTPQDGDFLMSNAPSISPNDTDVPDTDDPEDLVEEHRDLIERVASADVSLSDRAQRVLDYVDDEDGDRDD
jgi:hypothetical protein